MEPLIFWTDRGLYCPAGDFHIDPHRAVDRAVITHAHSDHARRGSKKYYCTKSGEGLLRSRLGRAIDAEAIGFGERFKLGDAWVSFHPAGHVLGSAQVRVEAYGQVWVASGDYKREPDPTCEPFESVACDAFITEATFGTPRYRWAKSRSIGSEIQRWWDQNASKGINCLLFGYSLGKAQRILGELAPLAKKPVWIHQSIEPIAECYRAQGVRLCETRTLPESPSESSAWLDAWQEGFRGEMILAPPSITRSPLAGILGKHETAFASGWMIESGGGYGRGNCDRGFVISDHADWDDLNRTIRETGARRIYVQHRGPGALVRHLRASGLEAFPIEELAIEKHSGLKQLSLF